ncbi:hypothetical protein ERJ75_000615500 [Trypanosoma vivax]|nr:hypothetical protein ERJ75_000615500 [Trypanosoma vivax]
MRQRQNGATPKSSEKNKGEDRHKAQRSGRPFPRREVKRLARVECEARQRGVGRGRTQETDEEHSREEDGLTGHRDMGGRTYIERKQGASRPGNGQQGNRTKERDKRRRKEPQKGGGLRHQEREEDWTVGARRKGESRREGIPKRRIRTLTA